MSVVAVTGATEGIGLGIARQFAVAGHQVIAAGRDATRGAAVERELRDSGLDVTYVSADVATVAGSRRVVEATIDRYGALDALVNNAGTVGPQPLLRFADTDEATFDLLLSTNLRSVFFTTQVAAPVMRPGGVIFNIGSIAGERVGRGMVAYRTSKAAVMFLSDCLAEVLRPDGITVHTIVVHRVRSDGGDRTLAARIADEGLDAAAAARLRDDYLATAVEPDELGRRLAEMLDHPAISIGPGFTVRRAR